MTGITDIRQALKSGNIVFGVKETIRNLKIGKAKRVFLAANCPASIKDDILHYSKTSGAEVVQLKQLNDELALISKRGHNVSVISVN